MAFLRAKCFTVSRNKDTTTTLYKPNYHTRPIRCVSHDCSITTDLAQAITVGSPFLVFASRAFLDSDDRCRLVRWWMLDCSLVRKWSDYISVARSR